MFIQTKKWVFCKFYRDFLYMAASWPMLPHYCFGLPISPEQKCTLGLRCSTLEKHVMNKCNIRCIESLGIHLSIHRSVWKCIIWVHLRFTRSVQMYFKSTLPMHLCSLWGSIHASFVHSLPFLSITCSVHNKQTWNDPRIMRCMEIVRPRLKCWSVGPLLRPAIFDYTCLDILYRQIKNVALVWIL